MKKIFSLFAAVLFAGSMMAATVVTFTKADFSGKGTASSGSAVSVTKSGVTVSTNKGYGASESLRCYKNAKFTVTSESEAIAKISFTFNGTYTGGLDAEVTVGALTYEVASLASQARFEEINVTLAAADEVLAPSISGDVQFFDEQEIKITCGTTDAIVYYTLDGTDPTAASTKFEDPFKLTADATVKAIAIKGDKKSDITTKAFRKAPSFASFKALIDASLAEHTYVEVAFEDLEIDSIYLNGQSKRYGFYFTVETKAYEVYSHKAEIPAAWVKGGKVSGTIRGDWYSYNSLWEIVPLATDWTWETLTYKAPEATAVENVDAAEKAIKVFENGQLVIIKNGVRYNALGVQF